MISNVSCVVLAGGESSRMGRDKAHVKLGERFLLDWVLDVVTPLFDDVMVSRRDKKGTVSDKKGDSVLSSPAKPKPGKSETVPFLSVSPFLSPRIIEDQLNGRGPVIGLCSALQQARHSSVFVTACDMPFIAAGLITYLASLHSKADIVVPVRDGRPEPLCAVYSRSCLEELTERVKQGKRGLTSFIRETSRSVHYVDAEQLQQFDPALHSFVDIDSTTALIEAEAMLEKPGLHIN